MPEEQNGWNEYKRLVFKQFDDLNAWAKEVKAELKEVNEKLDAMKVERVNLEILINKIQVANKNYIDDRLQTFVSLDAFPVLWDSHRKHCNNESLDTANKWQSFINGVLKIANFAVVVFAAYVLYAK